MPIYEDEPVVRRKVVREPVERRVVEEPVVERRVVEEPVERRVVVRSTRSEGWAESELVRYGFILLMTIIVLYFLSRYIIPMIA